MSINTHSSRNQKSICFRLSNSCQQPKLSSEIDKNKLKNPFNDIFMHFTILFMPTIENKSGRNYYKITFESKHL